MFDQLVLMFQPDLTMKISDTNVQKQLRQREQLRVLDSLESRAFIMLQHNFMPRPTLNAIWTLTLPREIESINEAFTSILERSCLK